MKMTRGIGTWFSGALLTLALTGLVQASGHRVELKFLQKEGTIIYQRANGVLVGEDGTEIPVSSAAKVVIRKVRPNGDFVVIYADPSAEITPTEIRSQKPVSILTFSRYGEILSRKLRNTTDNMLFSPEITYLIAIASSAILPQKPVSEGETWKTAVENPVVKGNRFTITTSFLGKERVRNHIAYKIRQTAVVSTDRYGNNGMAKFTVVSWIGPETGITTKISTRMERLPTATGLLVTGTITDETYDSDTDGQ